MEVHILSGDRSPSMHTHYTPDTVLMKHFFIQPWEEVTTTPNLKSSETCRLTLGLENCLLWSCRGLQSSVVACTIYWIPTAASLTFVSQDSERLRNPLIFCVKSIYLTCLESFLFFWHNLGKYTPCPNPIIPSCWITSFSMIASVLVRIIISVCQDF